MTDYWAETEAIEDERHDADIETAWYVTESNRLEAGRRKGICPHSYTVRNPDNGPFNGAWYKEAANVGKGEVLCLDICGKIIADPWTDIR